MADNPFKSLAKLFSSDVVVRNIGGKRLKIIDPDLIQSRGTYFQNDKFTRMYSSSGMHSSLNMRLASRQAMYGLDATRLRLFRDYECLVGETIIPTPDGKKLTIKELSKKYSNKNTQFYVYSYDKNTNSIVLGNAHSVRKTKTEMTYKIILDNDAEIIATANHPFLMRNGNYKRVDELKEGDSLMPFYGKNHTKESNAKRSISLKKAYENIDLSGKNNSMFGRKRNDVEKRKIIESLGYTYISFDDILNKSYDMIKNNGKLVLKELAKNNDCSVNRVRKIIKQGGMGNWNEYKEYVYSTLNHKIKKIELYEVRDVYDMTVEKHHNFATEHCFVHNSMDTDPILNSALDVYAEECVGSDTIIPLLNGEKKKIKDLYDNNQKNFWVYSIDDKGKFIPAICQFVKYNGKKRMYKLTFEDGTSINASENHLWVVSGKLKYTSDIVIGDSVDAMRTKLSDHKSMPEYEMINENGNLTTGELLNFIKRNNYNSFSDLIDSHNHRIINVEYIGEQDAYDLVNVGNNHIYAVEANDGSKLYCHNSTMKNEVGNMLKIKAGSEKVKDVLDNLFNDILNIEFNLPTWVRGLCKYGDYYLNIELAENYGITGVIPFPVYEVQRREGEDLKKPHEVKFYIEGPSFTGRREFHNFEMVHFRLLTDTNFLPYGRSMIEGARRVWKQLVLMEDAMLIHRIMRAPERRIFRIDVGNLPPNEIDTFMQKIISQVKKVPYIDEETGEYNLKFNLQNMTEDFYLPVRGGDSGTSIDNLAGLEYNAIEDIEYLRNKMMAALKIPKAFLGYEENVGSKATLACLVPETKIPLLNGKTKTIKELIDDYKNGIKNYVYSINEDKKIVPGEISWAGYTRKNAKLVRVHLDNGKYIDCTPDHRFLTRDGKWIEAKDLQENESLMPLYLNKTNQKNKKGYTTVYHPSTEKYEEVHLLIAEYYGLTKKGDGKVVHHCDFDKTNNYVDNIDCSMDFWEHRKFHQNIKKGQKNGQFNKCLVCKNEFYVFPYRKNSKFCSVNCYWESLKTRYIHECIICKKEFYDYQSAKRKYCSFECSCVDKNPKRFNNSKYDKVEFNELIKKAYLSISFKDLRHKLNLTDIKTLYKVFDKFKLNKFKFIDDYMPLAKNNKYFINKNSILNHKVVKVEFLEEQKDTCDITINKYHNFATEAGVVVHNSEDVRFARTVERIQKIVISELYKLALIHLYVQGFTGNDLVDFELHLTSPSIIYEQEKIELWSSKISLARDIKELNMLSDEWIYHQIFDLSDTDIIDERGKVIEDQKRRYRLQQIENEGNDPAISGQAVDMGEAKEDYNLTYNEGDENPYYEPVDPTDDGRRGQKIRTRKKEDPFGEDPIGQKDYQKILKLDKDLNYDANKKKHLTRREDISKKYKRAEKILGKNKIIKNNSSDILTEIENLKIINKNNDDKENKE